MLPQSGQHGSVGQPGGLHANLPPGLHRERPRNGHGTGNRQQIHHEPERPEDRTLHRPDDGGGRTRVQNRGTCPGTGICGHRRGLLSRSHTKRVGRDVHRREKRRMGRAVGPRVQPWFLGRVLPGTDFRRMDDELRFGRHGKKGLRGQGHQILFQTWRGRVPNRSGGHERG